MNNPTDVPADASFCPNCGKPLTGRFNFCPGCGSPLSHVDTSSAPAADPSPQEEDESPESPEEDIASEISGAPEEASSEANASPAPKKEEPLFFRVLYAWVQKTSEEPVNVEFATEKEVEEFTPEIVYAITIFTTLCCFPPLGAYAIYYAVKYAKARAQKDLESSKDTLTKALQLALLTAITLPILLFLWLIIVWAFHLY